jgi:uncharacterized membrane protein
VKRSTLGLIAVVLAGVGVTIMRTLLPIAFARLLPQPPDPLAAEIYGVTGFLAIPALLGLIAAAIGRGRWWGLTAFVLSVAGSPVLTFATLLPALLRDGAFR